MNTYGKQVVPNMIFEKHVRIADCVYADIKYECYSPGIKQTPSPKTTDHIVWSMVWSKLYYRLAYKP